MATKLAPSVQDALDELPGDTLHAAMARAFAEIEAATKDATNPHFRSKYADLSSVIEAIKPALVNNGLFVTQRCAPSDGGVTVDTYVHHKSGENMFLGSLFVPANKQDAQGFGSALTYCKRYALQTAFVVPTEDDDGNAATRAANDRPTRGEAQPGSDPDKRREKIKLDGPYDTLPKLEKAAREFARTLRGMGSVADFEAWKQDPDVIAFVDQCKRDLPGWWFPNRADSPPDFTPLAVEVATTRRGLAEMEELETR